MPAAALVLLRGTKEAGQEVLLGRRHSRAGFMPGIYVVPGGRVEPEDGQVSGFPEDLPALPKGLDKETHGRAAAIARAALRETFEETGILYGTAAQNPGPVTLKAPNAAPIWQSYATAGLQPAFERLWVVARAITPTFSPRRFHTRFLLGDGGFAQGKIGGDGELEDIGWYALTDISDLPMANITKLVLEEALTHYNILKNLKYHNCRRAAAMFRWTGSKHQGGVSAVKKTLEA